MGNTCYSLYIFQLPQYMNTRTIPGPHVFLKFGENENSGEQVESRDAPIRISGP